MVDLVQLMDHAERINQAYVDNQVIEFLKFLSGAHLRGVAEHLDIGYYIKDYFGSMTKQELNYVIKEIANVAMKAGIDVSDELGPMFGVIFGEIFGNAEEN